MARAKLSGTGKSSDPLSFIIPPLENNQQERGLLVLKETSSRLFGPQMIFGHAKNFHRSRQDPKMLIGETTTQQKENLFYLLLHVIQAIASHCFECYLESFYSGNFTVAHAVLLVITFVKISLLKLRPKNDATRNCQSEILSQRKFTLASQLPKVQRTQLVYRVVWLIFLSPPLKKLSRENTWNSECSQHG